MMSFLLMSSPRPVASLRNVSKRVMGLTPSPFFLPKGLTDPLVHRSTASYLTSDPGKCKETHCLFAIGGFEKGEKVGDAGFGKAWLRSFLEASQSFIDVS